MILNSDTKKQIPRTKKERKIRTVPNMDTAVDDRPIAMEEELVVPIAKTGASTRTLCEPRTSIYTKDDEDIKVVTKKKKRTYEKNPKK